MEVSHSAKHQLIMPTSKAEILIIGCKGRLKIAGNTIMCPIIAHYSTT